MEAFAFAFAFIDYIFITNNYDNIRVYEKFIKEKMDLTLKDFVAILGEYTQNYRSLVIDVKKNQLSFIEFDFRDVPKFHLGSKLFFETMEHSVFMKEYEERQKEKEEAKSTFLGGIVDKT